MRTATGSFQVIPIGSEGCSRFRLLTGELLKTPTLGQTPSDSMELARGGCWRTVRRGVGFYKLRGGCQCARSVELFQRRMRTFV